MPFIAVVDYGAGNLGSVSNALKYLGINFEITNDAEHLERADAIILPGVGAFPDAVSALLKSGLWDTVHDNALKKPFLGICLGMQMLFSEGTEQRITKGLDLLKGTVRLIETPFKLPQIGWNSLKILNPCPLTKGLSGGEYVYFVHSYMADAADRNDLCSVTDYGTEVAAIAARGNVFGCQFHPEKSGETGLQILKNFGELMK